MGPGKPGKSWNFFSQDWKVVEKGCWSWKVLTPGNLLNSNKKYIWETVTRINIETVGGKGLM